MFIKDRTLNLIFDLITSIIFAYFIYTRLVFFSPAKKILYTIIGFIIAFSINSFIDILYYK